MSYYYQHTDLVIYKAAINDDWERAKTIFQECPALRSKPINVRLETPLMIAVGTNCSHNFVRGLMLLINPDSGDQYSELYATNDKGYTALHYAVEVGNTVDASVLVSCMPELTLIQNSNGYTPLILAASNGRKDMIQFLRENTLVQTQSYERVGTSIHPDGVGDGNLITLTIQAGLLDVAVQIVESSPEIVLIPNGQSQTALEVLATKPELFPSGSKLGFWGGHIYPWIPINKSEIRSMSSHVVEEEGMLTKLWGFRDMTPALKNISEIKEKHYASNMLVKYICKTLIEKEDPDTTWNILGRAIATAVRYGIYELIEECILAYPGIIWYRFEGFNLFHLAIKERQVQVFNLVYQMSSYKTFAASEFHEEEQENALHIAAKLAQPHRLNIVNGAALQMQRELQWFKEVENFVEPAYAKALNKDGKTPKMVFTDEHKSLLKEGQQWMKDTASSCTVVVTLIVTITFAAAITVPGGNRSDGKPLYLNKWAFMLFIISDAFALFSSSTSLLMLLGILTSRYAEDRFLYKLPKRLTIGLVSMFLSIAAAMIAFGATLALLLHDKVLLSCVAAPIIIITSAPVGLFAFLQFRLLVKLVYSTYGPSIFHKQNKRMIH